MEITEVRISQMKKDKLKAFASVTFDGCFVVHDIKVIDGPNGLLVCMPSKKAQIECPKCRQKIHSGSMFCPLCGERVPISTSGYDRKKDHRDVAHPINDSFRRVISDAVLSAYSKSN